MFRRAASMLAMLVVLGVGMGADKAEEKKAEKPIAPEEVTDPMPFDWDEVPIWDVEFRDVDPRKLWFLNGRSTGWVVGTATITKSNHPSLLIVVHDWKAKPRP